MSDGNARQLAALSAGLLVARRRIRARRLQLGLSRGIDRAALVLLVCAAITVALAAIPSPVNFPALAVISLAAAIIALLWQVLVAATRGLNDPEAAERLDLAMVNHNRIATAYDLLSRNVSTPMARAAIADGIDALSRANTQPATDAIEWNCRRVVGRLAGVIILLAAAMLIPLIKFPGKPRVLSAQPIVLATTPSPIDSTAKEQPPKPPVAQDRLPHENPAPQGNTTAVAPPTTPASVATAHAAASSGASSGANSSKSSSGEPAGGADAKKQSGLPPAPSQKQDPGRPSLGSGMGGGVQGSSSGSVGAGGKGAGGKSLSVENESRRQDASELEAKDDAGGDSAEPDDNNGNRHRGGAQPLLQDRQPSPTRELGMSGMKGMPGNGRGGPTPTKKARGAGSLLLGVPVPDFIPGKLLAGLSKISRENIKPRRVDLPAPGPAEVADRATDESTIERFDIGFEDSQPVLRYFNELHREEPPAGGSSSEEGATVN